MKKELLIASALTASLGMAGIAEAADVSFSGNVRNGVKGKDTDGTADGTYGSSRQSSLSFSVSQVLDSGTKISSGFNVIDEGSSDIGDNSGITLTFTDGSKLDLIEAVVLMLLIQHQFQVLLVNKVLELYLLTTLQLE
jgi:hypothetical protein